MISPNVIEKIKEASKSKAELNANPANGVEAITIKETKLGNKYSVAVAVGKIFSINARYFETQGYLFTDLFERWEDSNLRIEPKTIATTRGNTYSCFVFPDG